MKSLTNVIFKNSRRKDSKLEKNSIILDGLAFFIVFASLAFAMIFLSYYVTKRLETINQTYAFVNILFLMNFMILFVKSVFESLNVLYFSKDLKILLRMPLKPKYILNSKILNMIVSEYQMELIMLAIPMIVYGILTKVTIVFYLYMILILLVLPIIPIIITSSIIAIIMRFTNFIKNKSKVVYITMIITMLLISFLTTNFNMQNDFSVKMFENIILKANGLAESIADYLVLIKPIMNTLLNYDNINGLKNLFFYLLENIVCYFLGILFMSKIYLKGVIGATINSNKKANIENEELTLEDFNSNKLTKSYINKEKNILKRTPIFFIQCIIMPILYPIVVLVVVIGLLEFAKLVGENLWIKLYDKSITNFGTTIFLSVGQVFYMMNFNSVIAISKDSKYAKLIKYLPIPLSKQFKLKINLGFKINMIATIIISICNYYFTRSITSLGMLFFNLILLNVIGEEFKLLIDLNNPKINWTSEYTMMKENTNVMYILFYTLAVSGILFALNFLIPYKVYSIFIAGILIIIYILLNEYIRNNQEKLFSKIY